LIYCWPWDSHDPSECNFRTLSLIRAVAPPPPTSGSQARNRMVFKYWAVQPGGGGGGDDERAYNKFISFLAGQTKGSLSFYLHVLQVDTSVHAQITEEHDPNLNFRSGQADHKFGYLGKASTDLAQSASKMGRYDWEDHKPFLAPEQVELAAVADEHADDKQDEGDSDSDDNMDPFASSLLAGLCSKPSQTKNKASASSGPAKASSSRSSGGPASSGPSTRSASGVPPPSVADPPITPTKKGSGKGKQSKVPLDVEGLLKYEKFPDLELRADLLLSELQERSETQTMNFSTSRIRFLSLGQILNFPAGNLLLQVEGLSSARSLCAGMDMGRYHVDLTISQIFCLMMDIDGIRSIEA
jgi:hypothetical protein